MNSTGHPVIKDPNENYLVLRKNDIVYIRRNYKTAKSYGEKVSILKTRKVRRALQEYVAQQTKGPYKYPFLRSGGADG